jgi:hypothetical protein
MSFIIKELEMVVIIALLLNFSALNLEERVEGVTFIIEICVLKSEIPFLHRVAVSVLIGMSLC